MTQKTLENNLQQLSAPKESTAELTNALNNSNNMPMYNEERKFPQFLNLPNLSWKCYQCKNK